MDQEQAERFVAAAEHDYAAVVGVYRALVTESSPFDVDEVRDARADVLAAQQALELARTELQRAKGGAKQEQERVSALQLEGVPPREGGLSSAQRAALVARYARLVDDLSTAGSLPQMDDLSARRTAYHEITGALGLRFVATEQGWALERVP